ncbi:MAG: hypothetical protein HOE90_22670 [Bacteriovoracaceae bacterium]|nr:hypothetical protein [Bacteriovoracaceae bacterium]
MKNQITIKLLLLIILAATLSACNSGGDGGGAGGAATGAPAIVPEEEGTAKVEPTATPTIAEEYVNLEVVSLEFDGRKGELTIFIKNTGNVPSTSFGTQVTTQNHDTDVTYNDSIGPGETISVVAHIPVWELSGAHDYDLSTRVYLDSGQEIEESNEDDNEASLPIQFNLVEKKIEGVELRDDSFSFRYTLRGNGERVGYHLGFNISYTDSSTQINSFIEGSIPSDQIADDGSYTLSSEEFKSLFPNKTHDTTGILRVELYSDDYLIAHDTNIDDDTMEKENFIAPARDVQLAFTDIKVELDKLKIDIINAGRSTLYANENEKVKFSLNGIGKEYQVGELSPGGSKTIFVELKEFRLHKTVEYNSELSFAQDSSTANFSFVATESHIPDSYVDFSIVKYRFEHKYVGDNSDYIFHVEVKNNSTADITDIVPQINIIKFNVDGVAIRSVWSSGIDIENGKRVYSFSSASTGLDFSIEDPSRYQIEIVLPNEYLDYNPEDNTVDKVIQRPFDKDVALRRFDYNSVENYFELEVQNVGLISTIFRVEISNSNSDSFFSNRTRNLSPDQSVTIKIPATSFESILPLPDNKLKATLTYYYNYYNNYDQNLENNSIEKEFDFSQVGYDLKGGVVGSSDRPVDLAVIDLIANPSGGVIHIIAKNIGTGTFFGKLQLEYENLNTGEIITRDLDYTEVDGQYSQFHFYIWITDEGLTQETEFSYRASIKPNTAIQEINPENNTDTVTFTMYPELVEEQDGCQFNLVPDNMTLMANIDQIKVDWHLEGSCSIRQTGISLVLNTEGDRQYQGYYYVYNTLVPGRTYSSYFSTDLLRHNNMRKTLRLSMDTFNNLVETNEADNHLFNDTIVDQFKSLQQ